ncbi:hypothetical protein BSKO_10205 [Bryopsis sp. KO-2023]|nr:hypothetical protein BSKO_10205 [Bryopsis sp. KO-2023]
MNPNSEEVLGACTHSPGFICVKDTLDAPASFLLPHLLKKTLESGYKAIFVAVDQSVQHYERVMRRLMAPLAPSIESGNLVMLDWLAGGPLGNLAEHPPSLKAMHDEIRRNVSELAAGPQSGKIALFVDCMTTLRSLCVEAPVSEWVSFLGYCRSMMANTPVAFRFVTLVHVDVSDDGQWLNWVEHVADVTITSQPLELISIAEVDGQVIVTQRAGFSGVHQGKIVPSRKLYFRLKDSGIRFVSTIATPV